MSQDRIARLVAALEEGCPRGAPCGLADCEAPAYGGCARRAGILNPNADA